MKNNDRELVKLAYRLGYANAMEKSAAGGIAGILSFLGKGAGKPGIMGRLAGIFGRKGAAGGLGQAAGKPGIMSRLVNGQKLKNLGTDFSHFASKHPTATMLGAGTLGYLAGGRSATPGNVNPAGYEQQNPYE